MKCYRYNLYGRDYLLGGQHDLDFWQLHYQRHRPRRPNLWSVCQHHSCNKHRSVGAPTKQQGKFRIVVKYVLWVTLLFMCTLMLLIKKLEMCLQKYIFIKWVTVLMSSPVLRLDLINCLTKLILYAPSWPVCWLTKKTTLHRVAWSMGLYKNVTTIMGAFINYHWVLPD